jgi:tryptophan synthase alpha chain
MNNRITKLFKTKKEGILSIYFTAGFPELKDTLSIIEELERSGVDMIEIGVPFSDPLADGPTIQHSGEIALKNGMSINILFEQLKDVRKKVSIPLLLMGYINPVMQYGMERFCKKAKETGIDGLIIPDLPMLEYQEQYKPIFEKNNLSNIFLITPQSSDARIKLIDKNTEGFIYIVSSASTTGKNLKADKSSEDYFKHIKSLKLKNPTMIGFGIHDKESFDRATRYARGAIIGSSFINAIDGRNDLKGNIKKYVKKIKQV